MLKDELSEKAKEERLPLKILLKDALQIYILSELYALPQSTKFTFQGGTCLRLIYGGPRYSEDIDFITSARKTEIENVCFSLVKSLTKLNTLFNGTIEMKKQKESKTFYRFRIHNRTAIPSDSFFVSLEFACYPAYTYEALPLHPQKDLPGLPLTIVRAEKLEEILTDKLCALAGRPFCKGRDIFDLWFLKQKGVTLKSDLLVKKLKDYSIPPKNLERGLTLVSAENLKREMERFLPQKYRQHFESDNYKSMLNTAEAFIKEGIASL